MPKAAPSREAAGRVLVPRGVLFHVRVCRTLHPGAWWVWALALAAVASHTTNPLLLGMILAVAAYVVAARRTDAPWALGFRLYVWLGVIIVVARVLFRIIFGGGQGEFILFTLPELPLPQWAAGIQLFGPVAAEQLLGGFYDGLRLATMVICVGAANALANPKRLLKSLPGALYEMGTAVIVALSVAPQLVESLLRVRRARRLRRGRTRGLGALRSLLMPVLQDALDRSLALAAAMDSRGYGRRGTASPQLRLVTGLLVLGGLLGVCVGVYGLLDGTTPRYLGAPMLIVGLLVASVGMLLGGRLVQRSRYLPDRWQPAELAVVACGITAAAGVYLTRQLDAATLYPSVSTWPQLSLLPVLSVLVAVLPAWLAPPPPTTVPATIAPLQKASA